MNENNRYLVPGDEDFEPGSNDRVLKNLLHIKDESIMEATEEAELERTGNELPLLYDESHQFTILDIQQIHELWLADIYFFAGKFRTVVMSKGGFPFAAPNRIEALMFELESKYLKKYTPCHYSGEDLAYALGIVHVELIIIHPFREGNGRLARTLANLMAMQARKSALNYAPIDKTHNAQGYNKYIEAIHKGFDNDYDPIKNIFLEILKVS